MEIKIYSTCLEIAGVLMLISNSQEKIQRSTELMLTVEHTSTNYWSLLSKLSIAMVTHYALGSQKSSQLAWVQTIGCIYEHCLFRNHS